MHMKPNGTMKFLNKQPHLLFSHRDLSIVKHIVNLAPQEAQWFHCVERISVGNDVYYKLTEMLIPEQYCSAAEVDTSSEMMVSFYKQLKEQFGDETNDIMSKMTCWCHSHHNMGVSPSGQDRKQFKEQVELAIKRNITTPQIMIIFNKKNDYYCQIFDPELDLHIENAPIVLEGYNFSEYTEIAKKNFKKKVVKKIPTMSSARSSVIDWRQSAWDSSFHNTSSGGVKKKNLKPRKEATLEDLNSNDEDIIDYLETTINDETKDRFLVYLNQMEETATTDYNKLLREIESYLTSSELIAFDLLLTGKEEEIRVLEESYPDELDAGLDTENSLISLYEFFSDNAVVEEDFFTAMATAKLLTAESVTLPQSEYLVDHWLDFYNASATKPYSEWFNA